MPRRSFLGAGSASLAGLLAPLPQARSGEEPFRVADAIAQLEYLTREEDFKNVGRGKPPPHELSAEARRAAGLVPETWPLGVVPDPESDARVERPIARERKTAMTWSGLMQLAEKHAVRFLHVMACTNVQAPLGMGLWEGVPLREVIWRARPTANVRRVFYHGFHNDDPQQRFQSSLAIDRVLEDPPGELPVILCYKLNGDWLTPKRGGPVRLIVPGMYGNKSVKWLQRIVLTNNPRLNDTYAEWNNDTESQLKTCAAFLHVPQKVKAGQPIPITGVAQVGMSGLSKVQVWLHPHARAWPAEDPYFTQAHWKDAQILPPPARWGGALPDGMLPAGLLHFDAKTGRPSEWPLRHTIAHWTTVLTDLKPGRYDVRCRTIDANGVAQPMPRPFLKSGHNAIHRVALAVEA
jgi:DMSO/TMAO reductase YedYZ molybdopterin-dependent catalytic subunit